MEKKDCLLGELPSKQVAADLRRGVECTW
jgi:hypothetical protein